MVDVCRTESGLPIVFNNAYYFFHTEYTQIIKNEEPNLSAIEIFEKINKMWNEIKDTEKANKYKKMEDESRIIYDKNWKEWKERHKKI